MAKILRSALFLGLAGLAGAPASTLAQDYPSRLIKLIIVNAPGTSSDLAARAIAPEMSKVLGQPIVVENKAGANSLIGFEYVAKQEPADGYTMVALNVTSLATLPLIVKDLRFDPTRDLPPIMDISEGRYIFGSAASVPWKSFKELVVHAKANPGKLNYGASSSGTRLPTEALIRAVGVDVVHVPYSNARSYVQGLVAGDVQMGFVNEQIATSMGGKFRALAVTGERRLPAFNDAPTFAELGVPQIRGISNSLNVRAGTPKHAIDRLHAAASRALQQPEIKAQFAKIRLEIIADTPEAAARRLAEEAQFFGDIGRKIGIRPE